MSLTTKQIDELRTYAKDRKGELAKLINDAADTIELLSAKLHASQMERSSQYYHGGWIPCRERMPEVGDYVICSQENGDVGEGKLLPDGNWLILYESAEYGTRWVKAWMPLPEVYREEGD